MSLYKPEDCGHNCVFFLRMSNLFTIRTSLDSHLTNSRQYDSMVTRHVLQKIFPIVVVSATIPPPFGKVLSYLNIPWMYNNKQYENNDEKE